MCSSLCVILFLNAELLYYVVFNVKINNYQIKEGKKREND